MRHGIYGGDICKALWGIRPGLGVVEIIQILN